MTETTTQIKEALSVAAADYRYRKEEDHAVNRRHWERREDLMDRALSALSAAQPLEGEPVAWVKKTGDEILYGPNLKKLRLDWLRANFIPLYAAAHWLRGGQPVAEQGLGAPASPTGNLKR